MKKGKFKLLCKKIQTEVGEKYLHAEKYFLDNKICGQTRYAMKLRLSEVGIHLEFLVNGLIWEIKSVIKVYGVFHRASEWIDTAFESTLVSMMKKFRYGYNNENNLSKI